MSGNLKDFLVALASNPDLMTEFAADPARVLDRTGLAADERAALLGRDSDRLRRALGAGAVDHMSHITKKKKGARKRPGAKKPAKKKGGGSKKR